MRRAGNRSTSPRSAFGTWYVVKYVVEVDRPERRIVGLPMVAPGTRIVTHTSCSTQRDALAFARDLIGGEYDGGAEYVCAVEVTQRYPHHPSRTVRKRVERARTGDETAAPI